MGPSLADFDVVAHEDQHGTESARVDFLDCSESVRILFDGIAALHTIDTGQEKTNERSKLGLRGLVSF